MDIAKSSPKSETLKLFKEQSPGTKPAQGRWTEKRGRANDA